MSRHLSYFSRTTRVTSAYVVAGLIGGDWRQKPRERGEEREGERRDTPRRLRNVEDAGQRDQYEKEEDAGSLASSPIRITVGILTAAPDLSKGYSSHSLVTPHPLPLYSLPLFVLRLFAIRYRSLFLSSAVGHHKFSS